jgi:hypothetical protein
MTIFDSSLRSPRKAPSIQSLRTSNYYYQATRYHSWNLVQVRCTMYIDVVCSVVCILVMDTVRSTKRWCCSQFSTPTGSGTCTVYENLGSTGSNTTTLQCLSVVIFGVVWYDGAQILRGAGEYSYCTAHSTSTTVLIQYSVLCSMYEVGLAIICIFQWTSTKERDRTDLTQLLL